MIRNCDNTSVGVIVRDKSGDVLLLERARFPFGLAAPAGHIDEHGNTETAAVTEVFEETGLRIPLSSLRKVIDARRINNQCRRPGGDHHVWTVFMADNIEGAIEASPSETLGARWVSPEHLDELAEATTEKTATTNAVGAQVLELIWLDFFTELGLITSAR